MGFDAFYKLADHFGVPVGILVVLATAAWKVIRWLAPRVDQVVKGHVSLVSSLEESVDAIAKDGKAGHIATHEKLDALHTEVLAIPEKVKRA